MADEIKDAILDVAQGPARASNDSGSIDQQKLTDMIAADKYVKQADAVTTNPRFGMRFAKLSPPGTA